MPISMSRRHFARCAAMAAALTGGGCASLLVPKPEALPRWAAHDAASTRTVDHAIWAEFLRSHVTTDAAGINRVAYARVTAADRAALRAYLARLSVVEVRRLTRDQQFAYWVNLYNAATVDLVLAHDPVKSILDIAISPGPIAPGPWGARLIRVEDAMLSLGDIEHGILRPLWRDARGHYALNCASLGCPNLRREPWSGIALDDQLAAAARAYVNHPRGARIDGGRLTVSSLYAWYEGDFGGSESAVLRHLRGLATPDLARQLAGFDGYDAHDYDWALNDAG